MDIFTRLTSAAHSGAFGLGAKLAPTAEQVRAGNYKKGCLRLHGLPVTIETPIFTPRTGKTDGKAWSIVCMAHYGYINGTKGADGDQFDVFVGPTPESRLVVVVNQVSKDGSFDEHKAVLGFPDQQSALTAYRNSYERNWRGLGSYVACTIKQFKAWLKNGDLTRPMVAADLIHDEESPVPELSVNWQENNVPQGQTIGDVLQALRSQDADGLLLDSATMADVEGELSDGDMLDALVIEYVQFQRKANQLLKVMQLAGADVKAETVEVSKPFKSRGTTQVAMLFAMSDGQSVSVFFHNPDTTPNKLTSSDELISWKWVLNKRDITVAVAPEKGADLNPRQVARRIMALVEKNSAKFLKAAGANAEKSAQIEGLKSDVQSKTGELQALDAQIADLQAKLEQKNAAQAATGPASQAQVPEAGATPQTDLDYAKKYLEQAEAIGEQIKALGATPMTRDEFMAKVNAGELQGFSIDALNDRLSEAVSNLRDLKAGNITARSILGKGGGKKAAIEWLEKSIEQTRTAINSDGILATVNASNFLYHAKAQLRGLEAQSVGGEENQDFGNGADDPEAQKIARLLEMLAAARARLAAMAPGSAFYGNLVRDIADMASQLWDTGYRGPEANQDIPLVSGASIILEDYADVAALGSAMVISVGSENVYFDKDGRQYMTKLLNTDDYENKVGQIVDLSGVVEPQAPDAAQPDMLGDDANLRDNRTSLEKLTDALKAGNTMGALGVLDAIEDVHALRQLVLEAGFSLGASGTKDEILAGIGKDLVRAAKAKVDGFGLRELDKPAEPVKPVLTFQSAKLEWSEGSADENKAFDTLDQLEAWFKATYTGKAMASESGYSKNKLVIRTVDQDGNEREDVTRVDVSKDAGDFNPTAQTLAAYLSENGFGGLVAGAAQVVPAPAVESTAQTGGSASVDDMKAVMTENKPLDVPGDWLVMNAPRPLVGDKVLEGGEFLTGRFYAAIDPAGKYAATQIDANRKLDAAIVMQGVSRETQMAMTLVENKYKAEYLEMPLDERFKSLAGKIKKINGQPYGDLKALMARADMTPAAASEETEDTGEIAPDGRENTVKTAKGTKVVTGFKVIEAKKLIISHETDGTPNPDYPSELQPRDRARATSQAWVQKTARALDPDSLGRTNRADSGAPIVGSDRVVESGNGRAMAIREAYRIGQADEYREWLEENAEYFKVDAAKIARMKAPVLVRVRVSKVDRAEFAVEANQDDKLAMTATEKARSDAKRLDTAMLAKLADGDLNSGSNREFIAAFLQSLGDAEAAQYLTTDGRPTSSLINRVQAALFAGAYSDDRLLELTADVSKPEIANIVSALNSAAPDFMRAKDQDITSAEDAGERVTDSVEMSLNQEAVGAIINATNMLRQAKESGMGLEEFLRQGDMFGDVDPAVAAMAVFISQNNRSAKRLGTAFKAMAQFVETENARKQTAGLFGDEPASFTDIVKAANAKLEQEYGEGVFAISQNDLFSHQPAADKENKVQEAKAYLDGIIDGTADLSDHAGVLKEVERIYAEYTDELGELVNQAAEAFSQYALKKTADDF